MIYNIYQPLYVFGRRDPSSMVFAPGEFGCLGWNGGTEGFYREDGELFWKGYERVDGKTCLRSVILKTDAKLTPEAVFAVANKLVDRAFKINGIEFVLPDLDDDLKELTEISFKNRGKTKSVQTIMNLLNLVGQSFPVVLNTNGEPKFNYGHELCTAAKLLGWKRVRVHQDK